MSTSKDTTTAQKVLDAAMAWGEVPYCRHSIPPPIIGGGCKHCDASSRLVTAINNHRGTPPPPPDPLPSPGTQEQLWKLQADAHTAQSSRKVLFAMNRTRRDQTEGLEIEVRAIRRCLEAWGADQGRQAVRIKELEKKASDHQIRTQQKALKQEVAEVERLRQKIRDMAVSADITKRTLRRRNSQFAELLDEAGRMQKVIDVGLKWKERTRIHSMHTGYADLYAELQAYQEGEAARG